MPPKQKKGKGGKVAKKVKTPLDDIDTSVITRAQLEEYCVRVYEELGKEKQYREFLRLDRDKLENMVAISREQLGQVRDVLRAKDKELEECKDRHRRLVGETRQQVIALVSDKRADCLEIHVGVMEKLDINRRDNAERVAEISSDIEHLVEERRNVEFKVLERRKIEEAKHAEDVWKAREEDRQLQVISEASREKSVNVVTSKLRERFAVEYKRLEDIKNKAIGKLIRHNNFLTHDLQHYFNKLVHHNMSVMGELKAGCEEMKRTSASVVKQYAMLIAENTDLQKSLEESKGEEKKLREKLAWSRHDQTVLKETKRKLDRASLKMEQSIWELEALNITTDEQEKLTRESAARDMDGRMDVRENVEECILQLEYIVTHLQYRLREADSILKQVKSIHEQKHKWHKSLQNIDSSEDTAQDQVIFGLTTMAQKRELLIEEYKNALRKHNIHVDNTGFQPLSADDVLKDARHLRVLVNDDMALTNSSS